MASQTRSPLTRLECPNCGSPIDQFNATTQALVCPTCGSHISIGTDIPEILSKGARLPKAPRPIKVGDRATIASAEYIVIGRVMYRGVSEGESFTWNEWLLGAPDGQMLWLSLDEKGWALFRKLRFRQQFDPQRDSILELGENKKAYIHERYNATIVGAEGELTWRAKPNEKLFVAEGAGSGLLYSIQQTPEELEVHEGRQIEEKALATAFKNETWLKSLEKFKQRRSTYNTAAVACVIAAIIAVIVAIAVADSGSEDDPRTVELSSNSQSDNFNIEFDSVRPVIVAVRLLGNTLPENSFIDIDVNIVSPDGTSESLFVQELWHETGVDEDGRWVETQYETSEMFVPTQTGSHTLEVAYDGSVLNSLTLQVTVRRNHIMPIWFFIYAVISGIGAAIFGYMASTQRPTAT